MASNFIQAKLTSGYYFLSNKGVKQAILVIILLSVFGVLMTGGFTYKDPKGLRSSTDPLQVNPSGQVSSAMKNLQLIGQSLVRASANPSSNPSTQPSSQPSASPTASIPPSCSSSKVAIDLLLDTSGSMNYPCINPINRCIPPTASSKITFLQTAVRNLLSHLQPDDLVAVQLFNENFENYIQLQNYQSNRPTIDAKINNLSNRTGGYTYMRDALYETGRIIIPNKNAHSDYNWVFVFLTDGYPEGPGGYFQAEDPTYPNDITRSLKDPPNNLRIVTVGLDLDSICAAGSSPCTAVNSAKALLQQIASNPPATDPSQQNFYPDGTTANLDQIYSSISSSICRP